MIFIDIIRNLSYNLWSLIKSAATTKEINWKSISDYSKNSVIDKNAKIYSRFNLQSVKVDKGTYISQNSKISNTNIGKYCSIGPNFLCGWGIHPIFGISTSPVFYSKNSPLNYSYSKEDICIERKRITIGNDVFIGMNVTVIDGVSIGDGAVIGAGAVVTKDIPPYAIAVGCPIRIIKFRFPNKVISMLMEIRWWDRDERTLQLVSKYFYEIDTFLNALQKTL